MAASPTLRPIPGGRQVPEDGDGGGHSMKGERWLGGSTLFYGYSRNCGHLLRVNSPANRHAGGHPDGSVLFWF